MVDLRCENLYRAVFLDDLMPEIHKVLWEAARAVYF